MSLRMELASYRSADPRVRVRKRAELGKRLTRRLSMVAKAPAAFLQQANHPGPRPIEIIAIAPDKTQLTLPAISPGPVSALVAPVLLKYRVCRPRLLLAGSRAEVDPAADVALLHGEVLLIEDAARQYNLIGDTDRRYRATEKLLHAEDEFYEILSSAKELYARPLARNYPHYHDVIFKPLADLACVSRDLSDRLQKALDSWNSETAKSSELFPASFWLSYWEYLEAYVEARRTLDALRAVADPLLDFLRLKQAAARHSPSALLLLPVQRLAEYERYLGQEARTLIESNSNNNNNNNNNNHHHHHNNNNNNNNNNNKTNITSGAVLQRAQLEGDLHRIQELFPGDNLRLHERDVLTTKMKSLIRKRNGPNPGRLTRALSQKNLQNISNSPVPATKSSPRTFLLETPVQFTTGMQSQDRHLFLFSDLLLIAKARSGGNFKLKQTVKMSELWLTAGHIEDVAESNKSQETSFVLGWPTTNVVATFMTAAARDLWWGRLTELVREESLKEPPDTNIQVVYHDNDTNTEYCKTIMVSSEMTAATCVSLATRLLDLQGPFQLWARTCADEAPYPLIGHERPFAIKLSNLRHTLSTEEGFDLEHCNKSGHDTCHFILRPILKSPIKKNKSKITGLLRRSLSLNPSIFGVNLSRLDENGLPKPVLVMLQQLFAKGPFTQGIFRKSANVRIVRELRDQIESTGDSSCLEDAPIIAVAALLKDFLRSLPDPLLTSHLFPLWMASLESKNSVQTIKSILDRLPKANYTLLSHLVCVLHHIARRSKHNLMCASNLGVCCGPSLLWSSNPTVNQSRAIPALTEMLIRHCEVLFGDAVTQLFGEERSDSGAEESTDSLHCGLSLDSLDLTEPPRKDHMSLSRDSGLTLSDCQLFIPESPVGSEDSAVNASTSSFDKSSADKDKCLNKSYIRVYNGWEDRLNSYTTTTTTTTTTTPTTTPTTTTTTTSSPTATKNQQNNELCRDDKLNYPNPNFQRQDWLRAQLKRTPRTKLEDDQRKERFDDKDIFSRDYLRQASIKENVENCKEIVFRTQQQQQQQQQQQNGDSCLESRISNHDSEQSSTGESTISSERSHSYDFKKERFDLKKIKSDYSSSGCDQSPVSSSQNGSYHSTGDLYEFKKVLTKHETRLENNNIYGNRETLTEIYSTRKSSDIYKFKQSETIEVFCDETDDDTRTWPDTPPPLPPRLRHLPPVHMSLEDRHKITGRSRSLPPPPPYRPPPQPRAPITTRHLGYPRSIIDDESYV
ncbi:rho GTPase-activating protein 20 isoform X2 [Microplitis demolitor]|uniref:rho GTPase-activating protein 20 isoform X2 n=1 Tax=Microplitis demolitor TaxID=69319 RepID=UPI0006D4EF57|nr:rho GTPase-activating protein 20 isoform X2 [Microplitis demolitor]